MTVAYVTKQLSASNTNLTDLYTVPEVIVSKIVTITICNRSATPTTFRVAHAVAGGVVADKDYLYYDEPVGGNKTFIVTTPLFGDTGDIIRVRAGATTLSFNLHAQETS